MIELTDRLDRAQRMADTYPNGMRREAESYIRSWRNGTITPRTWQMRFPRGTLRIADILRGEE